LPELPEVETVRRGLAARARGRVEVVVWLDARMVRGPVGGAEIARRLLGQEATGAERYGKFLVWRFSSGEGLLLHLGMSGRLEVGVAPETPWAPHTHLVVRLSDGSEVRLRDPRRFGRIAWLDADSRLPLRMGPDPLARGFTASRLAAVLAHRRRAIKAVLLDQGCVAGIGNIYADEALWRARIHPATPAGCLDTAAVVRLHRALRAVLREAIAWGGTSFRDYVAADGRPGAFARRLNVYGRRGASCRRCRGRIETIRLAGRTTHFCAACQKLRGDEAGTAPAGAER
jgi:formamidopyrimidine-DNA glycosylase